VKSGKAAGFDGIYPDFIKNSGQRTKEWIIVLFNDILTILKPGKDGSISLPSIVFKILERILQRIQPLFFHFLEEQTPKKNLKKCRQKFYSKWPLYSRW
jgi:hypothetical protein